MKRVIPGKIKTQLRLDGYYNVLNKYGTQHDSTEYYQWATGAAVTDAELADLYNLDEMLKLYDLIMMQRDIEYAKSQEDRRGDT